MTSRLSVSRPSQSRSQAGERYASGTPNPNPRAAQLGLPAGADSRTRVTFAWAKLHVAVAASVCAPSFALAARHSSFPLPPLCLLVMNLFRLFGRCYLSQRLSCV